MSKSILVVEDTPHLLDSIIQCLNMEGYSTSQALHGEEALQNLLQITPDLILTDLLMPVMDGYTFIKNVKANLKLKNIPIIVFSARTTQEDVDNVMSLGINKMIKKPCSLEIILSSIAELIEP